MTDENAPTNPELSDHDVEDVGDVGDLDELADYYDHHDTSKEMEDGEWIDPGEGTTTVGDDQGIR